MPSQNAPCTARSAFPGSALGRGCLLLGALLLASSRILAAPLPVAFPTAAQGLGTGSLTLSGPAGLAADGQGHVFIADTGHDRIVVLTRGGNPAVLAITGGIALSAPTGLAVDPAGDLFIADTGHNRVVQVAPGGAGVVLGLSGLALAAPRGVAVDAAGDVFIADTGHNRIVEVPAGGGAAAVTFSFGSVSPAGLSGPQGLAIDNGGNLYLADTGNARILKVAGTGAPGLPGTVESVLTPGSATLHSPAGVAVDVLGNVYIADGSQVVQVHTVGGSVTSTLLAPGTSFAAAAGIAVSPWTQVYLTDGDAVAQIMVDAVDCGTVPLGATGAAVAVPVTLTGAPTLTSIAVYTAGTQNLDFTIASGGTLSTASTTSGIVNVQFSPTGPGLRRGALVIGYTTGGAGQTLTIPLVGYSPAPLATLNPGIGSVLSVGSASIPYPFQTVLDGAGNVYVTSYGNGTLTRIPAGGGQGTRIPVPVAGDGSQFTGLALDGSGNLFISDYNQARVVALTPYGKSLVVATGASGGFDYPTALNFDPSGNLLVSDYGSGRLLRLDGAALQAAVDATVDGGTTPAVPTAVLGTGGYPLASINCPAIAGDLAGNVWWPDRGNDRIIQIRADGSATVAGMGSAGSLSGPAGIAVDPFGTPYLLDSNNRRVIALNGPEGSRQAVVTAWSGDGLGIGAFGLTIDGQGSLILADMSNNRLVFVNRSAASLAFPDTAVGRTSATRTVTVGNAGDLPLDFSALPTFTGSFIQDATDPNPVSTTTSLAPGASYDVPVQFAPQSAGPLATSITLTDNTLGVPGSTQAIAASGTGLLSAPTLSASNLTFSGVTDAQFTATWTRGGGTDVAVFAALAGAGAPAIADGTAYTANPAFGSGSTAGAGWSCVYNGTGTSVTVTGLGAATPYQVFVVEYNQQGTVRAYNTASTAGDRGTQATAAAAFTVTFATDGTSGAQLTGSASQQVAFGGSSSAVTAVAPAGYVFANWTGTNGFAATTANPLTLTGVTSAYAITAHFTAAQGLTLTVPGSPAVTVPPGGSGSLAVTLGSVGGVTAPVTLAASGLPAGVACAFSANPIDLSAGPATVTLTFTAAPSFRILGRNRGWEGYGLGAGATLLCGVLVLPGGRRRRRFGLFLSLLALLLAGGMTACSSHGGGTGATNAGSAVAAGTYPVTLTATASGVPAASTTVQLTIP